MQVKVAEKLNFGIRLILIIALFSFTTLLNAQDLTVIGKVTDSADGAPMLGATVMVKGTTIGSATNNDGEYVISNAPSDAILVISFIGYEVAEEPIGGRKEVNIALRTGAKALDEVVVTALGIERAEKALGYAQTTVSSDNIAESHQTNWTKALTGKVAGLSISSVGGPNASSKISLRGDNSLNSGGNEALVILDGIPINSKTIGSGFKSYMGDDNAVDYGSRLSDINPDDIESVSVLKGPSASALYGSRAANGVIIITTKSGSKSDKGMGITFNSSVSWEDVLHWPHYQYEYGEGSNNASYYSYGNSDDGISTIATATFGPKFDANKKYFQYNPDIPSGMPTERTPWVAYPDNRKDFFETGFNTSNSLSIEGGNEKSAARLSLSHNKSNWIMPNTSWQSFSSSLSVNHSVSKKLKITGKINYTQKDNKNLPNSGYNNHTIGYMMLFLQPNYDMAWYKAGYWVDGQENILPKRIGDQLIENPYFIAQEILNQGKRNSVTAGASAIYTISRKFDLMVRSGMDMGNDSREQRRPFNIQRYPEGMYRQQIINNYEINTDALLTYRTLSVNNIGLTASLGGNLMQTQQQSLIAYANKLVIPGVYNLANSKDKPETTPEFFRKQIHSVYTAINLSFNNKIFVDITGRNDWSSTLPAGNNSYFYPSVNSSFMLNELFEITKLVNYAKLRLSWAQVGNDALPYKTLKYYNASAFAGSLVNPSVLFNENLKPEITSSLEAGMDVRLFKNRFGIDLAVYESNSKNQILDIALAPESGYRSATLNSGLVRNRGVELMINIKPVQSRLLNWNTTITWNMNRNKVMELAEGMDYQPIGEAEGAAYIRAKVGGTTGDIYGYKIQRAPDGQMIFKSDGTPLLSATNNEYIGNAHPDWKGGITNEFTTRGFTLSFQFDGQMGGMLYSQSHHKMSQRGRLENTLPGREEGFVVGKGVIQNGEGSFSPNTVQVNPQKYYDQFYRRDNAETNTLDASFIKLRELRLEYSLPKVLTGRLKIQELSVAVFGNNLWLFSDFPIYDPETATIENSTIFTGYEMGQLPSTRTMGISLRVKL